MRTGAPGKNPAQKTSSKRTGNPKKREKKGVHYAIVQYENKGLSKNKTKPREIDVNLQYWFICMH